MANSTIIFLASVFFLILGFYFVFVPNQKKLFFLDEKKPMSQIVNPILLFSYKVHYSIPDSMNTFVVIEKIIGRNKMGISFVLMAIILLCLGIMNFKSGY